MNDRTRITVVEDGSGRRITQIDQPVPSRPKTFGERLDEEMRKSEDAMRKIGT
jgi:hypothetical protein